jgi:hypothetical protein
MYRTIEDISLEHLKARTTMIQYFGLGFIQVKLGPTYRLHFYTKDLPPIIGEEDVHNHRYGFRSTILHGTFTHKLFKLTDGDAYILEDENCREGFVSATPPRPCGIESLGTASYGPGERYAITSEEFHLVTTTNAITLLERGPVEKELAQIVRPAGAPKVCPFSQKIDERELWEIVGRMLKKDC